MKWRCRLRVSMLTACAPDMVIGNEAGVLQCGYQFGSLTCPEWGPDSTTFLPEEDL